MFEPYYDSYAACIAMAGARPVPVHAAAARLPARRRRAARRGRRRGRRLLLLNSPHNPTGKVFDAGRARRRRRRWRRARPARGHRRGLRAPRRSTAPRTSRSPRCPGCASARSRSRRAARRSHAPAGRSAGCAAPPRWSPPSRTAKQFLTYVNGGAVPAGHRGRARPARRVLRGARRRPAAPSATSCAPGWPTPGSTVFRAAGHLLRDRRHPPAAARRRRHGVLPGAAGAVRRRRRPERGLLRRPGGGAPPRPVRFCKRPEVLDEAVARLARLGGSA